MLKQVKNNKARRVLTLFSVACLSLSAFAEPISVKGHVKDATGEPVIGATVSVGGKAVGVTDFDGNFSIQAERGTQLVISYVGFANALTTASSDVNVTMQDDSQTLEQVVVIGYGVAKKSDLTGSVTAVKPDDKNKGLVVNAQDMIQGKIAGVNVVSDGGTPGGGSTIRIRGGSSLNGSNDPLIVIDGISMDGNGVKGLSNALSLVNPQDIESFTVLKDASATAIYGSRGSNGVIIITTKKGRKNVSVSYNGSLTVSHRQKTIDVMTGDEYRDYIASKFGTDSEAYNALGTANTDWQEEIMRTGLSHDHNITVSGTIGDVLPFRVSGGYTNQEGILKTSSFERFTGSLNLNPSLLQDHLKINFNAKGMWARSQYADTEAVSAAVAFDPTQSVHDLSQSDWVNFGGFFEWRSSGTALGNDVYPNTIYSLATKNPVAILEGKHDVAISRDLLLSADIDYQIHGLEDLHIHATLGADIAQGKQNTNVEPWSPSAFYYGSYGWEKIQKSNLQGSIYALYTHDFKDKLENHFDVMVGAEESRNWRRTTNRYYSYSDAWNGVKSQIYTDSGTDYDGDGELDDYKFETHNYLVSYFGRANYSLLDRYYLTATVRRDGSSRFKDHWSTFPSGVIMWRAINEDFLKDVKSLSNLNLRLGWGKTGQQAISSDYTYFATYSINSGVGSYYGAVGDGTLVKPDKYNPDLKWETTRTFNIGLDWGFFNQRLSGSIDWYHRKTTDLLNWTTWAAGTNFGNQYWSNVGSLRNIGLEASIHWVAIEKKDLTWTIDYNFTYNSNKITSLSGDDSDDYYVATGGISAGTGLYAQAHHVGNAASSFYVYQQVYDADGNPLEGVVVDRNGDGQITSADKYYYKSPTAPVTMGLSTRLDYKNWDLGLTLRASLGNYVYNDFMAGYSNCSNSALFTNSMYLTNRPTELVSYDWQSYDETTTLSDRWVQNASFLKCDNITLGYSFFDVFKSNSYKGFSGRVYAAVQNVFTITNYDGIDPEVNGGIDNNVYPRPRSFILGLSLNF